MNSIAGKVLVSTPSMDDPYFTGTTILITEHNAQGAMGFVINKIFERPLNELAEFSSSPAFPLYSGGPVGNEHLFFIHRRSDLIPGGTNLIGGTYFGGDFKQAILYINNKTINTSAIKVFIGYCGWGISELEAEIAEGSWAITESNPEIFFQ